MVRIQQHFRYERLKCVTEESAPTQCFRYLTYSLDTFLCQLWIQVADGDLQDSTRADLYEYIVDFLCSCSNLDLVWKYADWALRKDPTVGYQYLKSPQMFNSALKVKRLH